ncbi:zinc finger transcription factor YY1 isoform X1 [Selaginella moellendorffii]|uniref:zinc finger transcription factor YY1 isoform X1 n=1 Tax=Selaginella moellendorffii TaxID=88036 RepID=UPI000D1C391A|nr:zinc finger transcription factor YY1 isoform X1 [Selaginella moellendorffii]|eukprot:XP_024538971.1 zinc finger transcription factor YY1 isoform X1 [Selaginella moellendorffii]
MDGELLIVPGTSMPQMIQPPPALDGGDDHPKRKPAKKWFKEWVPQDTVLSTGKCRLLKWINDDTMNLMKTKHLDQDADLDYEIVYVCTFENCGKVFTEAPALRKHAHVHGEKQFICHYDGCGKRFVDSSKLKRHFLIHTGEKHFLCKFCGKAFSLDFNLRSHMRTHTGENYHTCPYEDCGKRYAHEYKLRGHLKTHHDKLLPDGKQVPLTLESDTSKTSPAATAAAAAAAAATGGGRPFACPYKGCDKRYFYEYKLNLHLKRGHVKEEMVEHNGSDEFSDGSDPEHLVRGPGKGKMRLGGGGGGGNSRPASTAAPRAKRKKTVAAGGGGGTSSGMTRIQEAAVVETNLVGRKVIIKHEIQEDSEETEDEGRDDLMDDAGGNDEVFEDDEETEDDVD